MQRSKWRRKRYSTTAQNRDGSNGSDALTESKRCDAQGETVSNPSVTRNTSALFALDLGTGGIEWRDNAPFVETSS